eukprot:scaffold27717_cov17-Tisochrysis_lutea.AAC.3
MPTAVGQMFLNGCQGFSTSKNRSLHGHSDKSVRLLMPACFCKIGVGPCVHEANHGRFLHAHPSHLTYSTRFQQIPNTWETTHRHTFVPKEPPGRMPVGVPGPRPQLPWMNDGTTYNNHFDPKVR